MLRKLFKGGNYMRKYGKSWSVKIYFLHSKRLDPKINCLFQGSSKSFCGGFSMKNNDLGAHFNYVDCVYRTKTACCIKIKYWLTFYLLLSYLTPLTYFRWADFEWFATTNFASDLLCLPPTFVYCYQYDLNRNELA